MTDWPGGAAAYTLIGLFEVVSVCCLFVCLFWTKEDINTTSCRPKLITTTFFRGLVSLIKSGVRVGNCINYQRPSIYYSLRSILNRLQAVDLWTVGPRHRSNDLYDERRWIASYRCPQLHSLKTKAKQHNYYDNKIQIERFGKMLSWTSSWCTNLTFVLKKLRFTKNSEQMHFSNSKYILSNLETEFRIYLQRRGDKLLQKQIHGILSPISLNC